ncbi:hypothetical protein ABEB36_001525 [Hypothenemus hampei]|uniref:Ig-like domain-containing protein n=1 Tax=Hypothenemus hampei TaxID=57062 RepID=A0ABD1FFG9_HYPHA
MALWNWIFFVCANNIWNMGHSLKITNLYVPREAGHDAQLDCLYDLEGEPLYDVKWYKDDHQFFRCMANGNVKDFPVEGVTIYYSKYVTVGSCPITLTRLTSSSAGKYKCEVSLDAPTFRTVSGTKTFTVVHYSRRTQEIQDIAKNQIKTSPYQNYTKNPKNGGTKLRAFLRFYVVILFIIGFYSF